MFLLVVTTVTPIFFCELFRGRLLKDKKDMSEALQKSFELVSGGIHSTSSADAVTGGGGPSAATMSRACMKLDRGHMLVRHQQWNNRLRNGSSHTVQLGFLSLRPDKEE